MEPLLDFLSEKFSYFLIYKLPRDFLPSFESFGLSVQEIKGKIDFQDGHYGSHLGFLIGMIFAIFDIQVSLILPSFKSTDLSVQEKKGKIDFQEGRYGGHLGFTTSTVLAIFDLQVSPILPTKFRVNWSFGSVQNRFSRWPPWRKFGFPIGTILAIFDLQVALILSTDLSVQEKKFKIDFQDGGMVAILDF